MSERPVALVTGGSSGIGAAVCAAFLEDGYEVVSLALDAPPRRERLHALTADLLDERETARVAGEIASQFAVSRFVHAAGIIRPALLADVPSADLADLTRLHLAAPLVLLQALLPGMRERRFGRVVLISSRAALGVPTRTAYAATKAGLIGMARTWALELAGDGITVNVVAPGPVGGTRMFHDVIPAGGERERALAASIPVGRLGQPEDVARAVLFFAAEGAGFVTGQTLYVCGGASVGSVTL